LPAAAEAQWTPTKPLRIISPYSAGGTNDLLSRLVAQKLGDRLGQPVVVENRAGANGIIGADAVAKSPADGYTILMGNSATHGINPNLYSKLPYDAARDFTQVGLIATVPLLLVVNPAVPAKDLKELIAIGKAKPGSLNYASPGLGSSPHLAGVLLQNISGLDMTHVPYKGDGPAVADLLGGQVTMMFANMPSALPHVPTGKLRALAMTGVRRTAAAPTIPTMAEAGVAGVEIYTWYGLMTPANLPKDVLVRLNTELNAVMQMPDVQERIRKLGADPVGGSAEEFTRFVAAELAKFAKVVKSAGIKAE
jgi:tripartite-type tricarboxylate transporter receptor subunit TctC